MISYFPFSPLATLVFVPLLALTLLSLALWFFGARWFEADRRDLDALPHDD